MHFLHFFVQKHKLKSQKTFLKKHRWFTERDQRSGMIQKGGRKKMKKLLEKSNFLRKCWFFFKCAVCAGVRKIWMSISLSRLTLLFCGLYLLNCPFYTTLAHCFTLLTLLVNSVFSIVITLFLFSNFHCSLSNKSIFYVTFFRSWNQLLIAT